MNTERRREQTIGPTHWVELDGVRGLAALLVVYVHLFLRWVPAHPAPVFWLRTCSGMAWTGVDLFFILSGFLIGGILLRNREAENYYQVFYLRRAFRILPLYFVLLVCFFAIRFGLPLGHSESFAAGGIPFWTYPLLIQNFPMAQTGAWGAAPLSITWSVALEEQFYIFLPLLIRALSPRAQLPVFTLLALSGPFFRWIIPVASPTFLLPGSLEPFFAGVILAWLYQHRSDLFDAPKWGTVALAVCATGGLGMARIAVGWGDFGLFRETVITVFWGAFLWLVLLFKGTRFTAPLRWAPLCWVGGISYGVYLLHLVFSHVAFLGVLGALPTESQGLVGFLLTCLAMALTLSVAGLSARYFERPLTALGHRQGYRKAAQADGILLSKPPTEQSPL